MAISLESISKGVAVKSPRLVLLGVEGVGKSSFAAGAPNPIFIPIKGEQGLDQIDTSKFPPIETHAELMEVLRVLYQDDHEYQTVVIDSMSALEPLIWEATCKEAGQPSIEKVGGGFGKGYIEALKFWRELMTGLDYLREDKGIGCILIGHVKTKEFADPEADSYTTYMFDIQEKAQNAIYRWADAILFANYKRANVVKNESGFNKSTSRAVSTGQRMLYTEKRAAHPGKNRYQLPYEMKLNAAEFWQAMAGKVGEPTK